MGVIIRHNWKQYKQRVKDALRAISSHVLVLTTVIKPNVKPLKLEHLLNPNPGSHCPIEGFPIWFLTSCQDYILYPFFNNSFCFFSSAGPLWNDPQNLLRTVAMAMVYMDSTCFPLLVRWHCTQLNQVLTFALKAKQKTMSQWVHSNIMFLRSDFFEECVTEVKSASLGPSSHTDAIQFRWRAGNIELEITKQYFWLMSHTDCQRSRRNVPVCCPSVTASQLMKFLWKQLASHCSCFSNIWGTKDAMFSAAWTACLENNCFRIDRAISSKPNSHACPY